MSTSPTKPATAPEKPRPAPRPAQRPTNRAIKESATAKPAAPPAEEEQPEDSPAPPRRNWGTLLFAVPSWLVSLIFHIVLLLMLALVTFTNPELREEFVQTSSVEKEEDVSELEEFDFVDQEIEILETTMEASTLEDMGTADIGDVTAPVTSLTSDVKAHENPTAVEIGQLFGSEGLGMSTAGEGDGATTFFGVRTEGNYFMYVVDNSNSMNNGKFEHAIYELGASIAQLPETSYYYIIFYSDAAYPLYHPDPLPRWLRATPENKHKTAYWLETVERCLQTRGEGAMGIAMKMNPDVLYLLGDGAFTDKAIPRTLQLKGKVDTKINTLGFNMKPDDAREFERVAKAFGGSFRSVKADPRMKELSKQKNRPKNNARNGDWGINLGKGKKKK